MFHGKHRKHKFLKNVDFMRLSAFRQNSMFHIVLRFLSRNTRTRRVHNDNSSIFFNSRTIF